VSPTTLPHVGESESSRIGHEPRRAGVERVDHHLPVGRPRDLDVPLRERRWRGATRQSAARIPPSRPTDQAAPPRPARSGGRRCLEESQPRRIEGAVQPRHECQRLGRQDRAVSGLRAADDLDLPHGIRHVGYDGRPRSLSGHGWLHSGGRVFGTRPARRIIFAEHGLDRQGVEPITAHTPRCSDSASCWCTSSGNSHDCP